MWNIGKDSEEFRLTFMSSYTSAEGLLSYPLINEHVSLRWEHVHFTDRGHTSVWAAQPLVPPTPAFHRVGTPTISQKVSRGNTADMHHDSTEFIEEWRVWGSAYTGGTVVIDIWVGTLYLQLGLNKQSTLCPPTVVVQSL